MRYSAMNSAAPTMAACGSVPSAPVPLSRHVCVADSMGVWAARKMLACQRANRQWYEVRLRSKHSLKCLSE
jgi:hypothetical protein